jgi:hypothetical protein
LSAMGILYFLYYPCKEVLVQFFSLYPCMYIKRLLAKINEEGNKQSVSVMRIINDYITRLKRQAARNKKSLSPEARAVQEAQLEAMKVDVEKLTRVLDDGVMQAVIQEHENLATRLRKFNEGLETSVDGESITSDPLGTWRKKAMGLTGEVQRRTVALVEEAVRQVDDCYFFGALIKVHTQNVLVTF